VAARHAACHHAAKTGTSRRRKHTQRLEISRFFLHDSAHFDILQPAPNQPCDDTTYNKMTTGSTLTANEEHRSIRRSKIKTACCDLFIFSVVATTLLLINWPLINIRHIEVSDFAANSLLIQKAKHLDLFVGNYSRVGFNHPGPAILYVQAFGELFLYDWMHLVASPFSGQMVASILYNAAWITAVFVMMRTILRSVRGASLATAVFLCVVAYQNFQFFAGMWFPELYFFPFAAILIAASRFASGKTDMLVTLATSAGFLINGHVSFLSTLGVILLLAVLYNLLVHHKLSPTEFILGPAYWKTNTRAIICAVFVLLLFFVPLTIETIRHPPGPIADYIAFGKQHHANSLVESVEYASQYWGGEIPFISAILVIGTLLACGASTKGHIMHIDILSVLAILFAATVAMIVYSKFGVDMLDQTYIGYFYYSVPAFAVSLIVVLLMHVTSPKLFATLAAVGTPVLLIVTATKVDGTPSYAKSYTQPSVIDLYNQLEKVRTNGRIVLDLNKRTNWEHVWFTIAGLEAYAKRRGNELFCIRQNWHILFTKEARCTPNEIASDAQYEVSSLTENDHAPADIKSAGLAIRRYPDDFSDVGLVSIERTPHVFPIVLGDGWAAVEREFVWMQSTIAHLSFKVHKHFSGTLQLDLGAFLPRPDSVHRLTITVNNGPVYRATFDASKPRQIVQVPVPFTPKGQVDVRFVDPDVVSPNAAGLSSDARTLGVSLYGFRLVN
jgi:hypothetical protein